MAEVRTFDTGATRDTEEGKLDFDGFLSVAVLERYAQYMNKHRKQSDGKLRDSDNWQKGIPLNTYIKSMWRHFFSVWKWHRKESAYNCDTKNYYYRNPLEQEEQLCALLFNVSGYLHELLKLKLESKTNAIH